MTYDKVVKIGKIYSLDLGSSSSIQVKILEITDVFVKCEYLYPTPGRIEYLAYELFNLNGLIVEVDVSINKLKEIETLVALSLGTRITIENLENVFQITNELMCDSQYSTRKIKKLKEIETLLAISLGAIMTPEQTVEIFNITTDLLCDAQGSYNSNGVVEDELVKFITWYMNCGFPDQSPESIVEDYLSDK